MKTNCSNSVIECITNRRSVRVFNSKKITTDLLYEIIDNAKWAPSGKNGQPWRVKIISNSEVINHVGLLTPNSPWVSKSPTLLAIYLDKSHSYNYIKDVQAIGAFIQNILLISASLNVSTCWIGEILNYAEDANNMLGINNEELVLMAMVAIGYSNSSDSSNRMCLDEIMIN